VAFGVNVELLIPKEIVDCYVIPHISDEDQILKTRREKRKKKYASDPDHLRYKAVVEE